MTLPLVCILELFRPVQSITAASGSEDAEEPASSPTHPDVPHDRRQKVIQNKTPPEGRRAWALGKTHQIILALAYEPSSGEQAKR